MASPSGRKKMSEEAIAGWDTTPRRSGKGYCLRSIIGLYFLCGAGKFGYL
jgi:hypothetical protein